jgi:hypothetical protein
VSDRYRILHADSGEPVRLDGRYAYGIDVVEAEIRARPEHFVLIPDPADYAPHGLIVRLLYDNRPADGDQFLEMPLRDETRLRLELVRVHALVRELVEVWRDGPSKRDYWEFEVAMGELERALPTKPGPPVSFDPDKDAF